jgi:hypothetical protein
MSGENTTKKPLLKLKNDYVFRYVFSQPGAKDALKDLLLSILDLPESDGSKLWDWMKLIATEDENEMEALSKKNDHLRECVMTIRKMSEDEAERRFALARQMNEARIKGQFAYAREEGFENGRAEGHAAGHAAGRAAGRAEGRIDERKSLIEAMRAQGIPETTIENVITTAMGPDEAHNDG